MTEYFLRFNRNFTYSKNKHLKRVKKEKKIISEVVTRRSKRNSVLHFRIFFSLFFVMRFQFNDKHLNDCMCLIYIFQKRKKERNVHFFI